ncbi:MAG: hypothetical protein JWR57_222 [Mycetocola sp.]|jgi:hypothetical protein|nr:hypothetical protein [Mycetocola sp.]
MSVDASTPDLSQAQISAEIANRHTLERERAAAAGRRMPALPTGGRPIARHHPVGRMMRKSTSLVSSGCPWLSSIQLVARCADVLAVRNRRLHLLSSGRVAGALGLEAEVR